VVRVVREDARNLKELEPSGVELSDTGLLVTIANLKLIRIHTTPVYYLRSESTHSPDDAGQTLQK
jgi:hypothetical protein